MRFAFIVANKFKKKKILPQPQAEIILLRFVHLLQYWLEEHKKYKLIHNHSQTGFVNNCLHFFSWFQFRFYFHRDLSLRQEVNMAALSAWCRSSSHVLRCITAQRGIQYHINKQWDRNYSARFVYCQKRCVKLRLRVRYVWQCPYPTLLTFSWFTVLGGRRHFLVGPSRADRPDWICAQPLVTKIATLRWASCGSGTGPQDAQCRVAIIVINSHLYIAKDPEGLDSDRWIPLRGGARIPRGSFVLIPQLVALMNKNYGIII